MWKKCRKKPIVVEFREIDIPMTIETREGALNAYPEGDFLIRGVEGEIYPIKKEIFYKTYDVIE